MGRLRAATVDCPCCGYRTLTECAVHEICMLCWWQDDGQDESDADRVRGGPNGKESLTTARSNFQDHLTMYPRADALWSAVDLAEAVLESQTDRKIREYEDSE